MGKNSIIIWDLGKTKCAAAEVTCDTSANHFVVNKQCVIPLNEVGSLSALTSVIEHSLQVRMSEVDAICIGAAGQYDGEILHHTNPYPYPMAFASLADSQNWAPFAVVHDYTLILCATFTDYLARPGYVKWLRQGTMNPYGRRVALGVGTGLGLKDGVWLSQGDFWFGINEMGHIGICFPPLTQPDFISHHNELLRYLCQQKILASHEPLTFETILSGDGLVRLHRFVTQTQENISANQISTLMQTGQASETLALFAWYLGLFVGTVQLTFMPTGGIWITGGVALNNLSAFDHPHFYQGIYASPAYQAECAVFPMGVLCHNSQAFIGGAFYAIKRLLR